MKIKTLLPILFSVFAISTNAQDIKNATSKQYKDIAYLISVPDNYDQAQNYPTIVFLHGGDGSNTKHHPSKYAAKAGIDFPFIVIAPSCNRGCSWSTVDLEGILKQASDAFSIDPYRIYLTGYSMGGAGTWANLKKFHHLFAAAAPMAPAGGTSSDLCQAKDLAIRVYHGTADYGYKNSQKMMATLKACGAAKAELISLEGKGHGIWPGILSDSYFYTWLLQHSRN